jgi:hypothetical protein
MPVSDEPAPSAIDSFWVEIVRLCILGWAKEMERDAVRAGRGLEGARRFQDEPTDDQIAGLEEAFWRLRSATEKADALISVAYGPTVFARRKASGSSCRGCRAAGSLNEVPPRRP